MEHLNHFGLARDPFVKDSLPALHFESDAAADAERRLLRGCLQHRSLCVLSGAVGLGKSTVLRRLVEQLDEERFEAHLLVLVHGNTEGAWLMTRLAGLLGVESPSDERPQLCIEIEDRLAALHEEGRHAVLVVDEAQLLARMEPLADLRGLLDLEHEGQHLLTVVLAGSVELERGLGFDTALAQRLDVCIGLSPLDTACVAAFINHRIRVAGGDPALFESDALAEIARRTGGVPRLILTLADNALHEAWILGTTRVGADAVERAARDMSLALASVAPVGARSFEHSYAAPGENVVTGMSHHDRNDRTQPEMAPLFDGLELDPSEILTDDGKPTDDDLETLLEDEIR